MKSIRLSPAQVSALECREGGGLGPKTIEAWQGNRLIFREDEAPALADELTEASNGEDAQAEIMGCKYARRAAHSLAVVSIKVARTADHK